MFRRHPRPPSVPLARLSQRLGYQFHNWELLTQALKHRSYFNGTRRYRLHSNERLELLGDAVLGLGVTEYLYSHYPDKEEGELTVMKSLIVSRKVLTKIAAEIDLGSYIFMNDAESRAGGRTRPSIISDSLEAVIGAIYLDGGFAEAVKFVHRHVISGIGDILREEQHRNFKSMLLEYAQARNWGAPVYLLKREEGPDHDKLFTVEVKVNNRIRGLGKGCSKKKAEQRAAQAALEALEVL